MLPPERRARFSPSPSEAKRNSPSPSEAKRNSPSQARRSAPLDERRVEGPRFSPSPSEAKEASEAYDCTSQRADAGLAPGSAKSAALLLGHHAAFTDIRRSRVRHAAPIRVPG